MKKLAILLLIIFSLSCSTEKKDSNRIRLALTDVEGYGPFQQIFGRLDWRPISEKGIWAKTEVATASSGIPNSWSYSNVAQVWFDSHQFAYQNYKSGNLSDSTFSKLKEAWNIDLDKRKLSEKPVKCFINVAIGANKKGELQYIIDSNYNNDFSDESIVTAPEMGPDLDFNKAVKEAQTVMAEISTHKGIMQKEVKLLILSNGRGNLIYNFPQIAKTSYLGEEILVSNGFANITYDDVSAIAINQPNAEIIERNEFIKINEDLYKNLGVDINTNELVLEKVIKSATVNSTKVGFAAPPFVVKKLQSNDSLRLRDFEGKFLYLEFWGTWCKPCIKEIPNLKKAYAAIDKNEVAFLGVAVSDTKEKLLAGIERYNLQWPQVLNSDAIEFEERYAVSKYPTSYILDKQGIILAKNVRADKLLDTLNYFVKREK